MEIYAHTGNKPEKILEFESWLGREMTVTPLHGDRRSWDAWRNVIPWITGVFAAAKAPFEWTLPMVVEGASLADAQSGLYDGHYQYAADNMLSGHNNPDGPIWVRLGVEHNGTWFPWSSVHRDAQFIASWRRIHGIFKGKSDRFQFIWNPTVHEKGSWDASAYVNPALSWPGGEFVDAISMDFYCHHQYGTPTDPNLAWDFMLRRPYGLQWTRDFAAQHGKPEMYSEWGIRRDDFGAYIAAAADWFSDPAVMRHGYWYNDSDYPGHLSSYPSAAAVFKTWFSRPPAEPVDPLAELRQSLADLEASVEGDLNTLEQRVSAIEARLLAVKNVL